MTRFASTCITLWIVLAHCAAVAGQTPIIPTRLRMEVADPESPTKKKWVVKVTVPTELGRHPDVENSEHPVAR